MVYKVTLSHTMHLGNLSAISRVIPLPKPCTWSHTSTVSRVTPSQTLYLGLHVHSLHGDTPSQTLNLGSHLHSLQGEDSQTVHGVHISKVSYVNPLQTLHLGSYVHSLHCDTPCQNLHLGLHIHSPPWTVFPRFVHRVTCPHSPGDPASLTLYCGIMTTVTKPHRPGTWVLRSMASMVNCSQTLHLR